MSRKVLININSEDFPRNWTDAVHGYMNRDNYRILNITTTTNATTGSLTHQAWFEYTQLEASDIPEFPSRLTLPY